MRECRDSLRGGAPMSADVFAAACLASYWAGVATHALLVRVQVRASRRRDGAAVLRAMTSAEPPARILRAKYLPRDVLTPMAPGKRRLTR